jgi:hypothetical protein
MTFGTRALSVRSEPAERGWFDHGYDVSWFNGNGHFEKSAMMAEEVSDDGRETPD